MTLAVDNLLCPGRPIMLFLDAGDGDAASHSISLAVRFARKFESRVLKLLPEEIVVVWPTERDTVVPTVVGQDAVLEVGSDRGVIQLSSHVVGTRSEPISALHIARSGDWSRRQLRLNVRLEVPIHDPEAFLLEQGGERLERGTGVSGKPGAEVVGPSGMTGDLIEATIRDLSAGGVLLASTVRLEQGAILRISFRLADGKPEITATTRVVWIGVDESARKYRHRAGCQFLDLEEREQDSIVRFIFARQTKWRRWGLL